MRTRIIHNLVILMFVLLGLGLVNLTVVQGKKLKNLSTANCIRLFPQPGSRGRILDRQGKVIVDNYLSYDLMIVPESEEKVEQTLRRLAQILGISFQDLRITFKSGFMAPFMPVIVARNIGLQKAIALEESKFELGNIIIQPHPLRDYPYGRLACHVIGYLSEIDHWRLTRLADYGYKTKDIVGFGGVEERYDYFLRQEEGALSVEVDNRGRFVRAVGFKSALNGKDIQLTLDLKAQRIAEECLGEKKGSVIIMDPYSGEIIAMANRPNFNPAVFVKKINYTLFYNLFHSPEAPLINRAISGIYPAGSVFKLVVAGSALETGKINLGTDFFCNGSINIGRQPFSCWDSHGQQNLIGAIAHSCNVFFYRTGLLLGGQLIHDYARRFAFGRSTGIDLPYEANGFVPSPLWKRACRLKNWFSGDTANFAIGQGDLLVSPLQIARMTTVFANKGNLVTPYIVKAVDGRDISVLQKKITPFALKEETLNYIGEGLRKTISEPGGTAHILSDLEVEVSGKTGTAQVPRGQPHGWFVGFFPSRNPQWVICVFLENGGSGLHACLVAKQIIQMLQDNELIS